MFWNIFEFCQIFSNNVEYFYFFKYKPNKIDEKMYSFVPETEIIRLANMRRIH